MKKWLTKLGNWDKFDTCNLLCWWKGKMKRNVLTQWVYAIFPFLITALLLIMMEAEGVLIMREKEFSFLKDTSNSICMTCIFILSYFLGSQIPMWLKKSIDKLKKYVSNETDVIELQQKITSFIRMGIIVLMVGLFAGVPFMLKAMQNEGCWMAQLSILAKFIYGIYLALEWYCSLCLLLYVLVGCYAIKKLQASVDFGLEKNNYIEVKKDFQDIGRCLGTIISYAILYVIGAFIIIINDNVNKIYGVEMMFYNNPIASITLVFLMLIGFAFVALPAIEFSRVVKREKYKELERIEKANLNINEKIIIRKQIEDISGFIFESTISKLSLLLSIVGPIATLVFKILGI